MEKTALNICSICFKSFTFVLSLPDGVIGNTFDSESKESRFDPWWGNK